MDISKERHIIKASDLLKYFDMIKEKQKNISISKVYSKNLDCPNDTEKRMYSIDTELYILFKNQYVLIIDYCNIDSLYVKFKKLNRYELEEAAKMECYDFFNRTDEVCDYKTMKISKRVTSIFEYGCIKKIKYKKVEMDYEVWENNSIIRKTPNKETFEEIIIILNNENEIHISPESAIFDGYVDVWCEGAKINIQEYSV